MGSSFQDPSIESERSGGKLSIGGCCDTCSMFQNISGEEN